MISVVYFGSHYFAASILEALFKSGQFDIKAVVTQPDRPAGRHQSLIKSAVKIVAEKYGMEVSQPESLKNFEFPISHCQLLIVCEYGLIIPLAVLDTPKLGSINVHYSLLPKYRGASPLQSALINGETKTGVTIMLMEAGLDSGPILAQEELPVEPDDTYLTLGARINPIAANLLIETAKRFVGGQIKPILQNDADASFCKLFTREDGKVDWTESAAHIHNLYRGLTPWPGIWTTWNGKRLKFQKIKNAMPILLRQNRASSIPHEGGIGRKQESKPGQVMLSDGGVLVGCGSGSIEIVELQLEGGKQMPAAAFVAGHKEFVGSILL